MRLKPIVGQPGNSSISSRVKLGQTTIQLGKRAGFDDVGHRLGLTTAAVSVRHQSYPFFRRNIYFISVINGITINIIIKLMGKKIFHNMSTKINVIVKFA